MVFLFITLTQHQSELRCFNADIELWAENQKENGDMELSERYRHPSPLDMDSHAYTTFIMINGKRKLHYTHQRN